MAGDLVPLPALAARGTDLTATLTPAQRATLEASTAAIQRDKGSQVAILILPTTQPETIEQFGIRCVVLLQEQMEVASQYRAQGTPMGYRIDREGRIASDLAVGAESLLKLADNPVGRGSLDPARMIDRRSVSDRRPPVRLFGEVRDPPDMETVLSTRASSPIRHWPAAS
jgi:hypothetical protein